MAIDIGPRIGLEGEKEFRDQIKNVNQQLKTLDSEMRLVAATFDDASDSQDALGRRTEVLNKKIETQQQKVKLLADAHARSAERTGKNSTETLRYEQQLNSAKTALLKTQSELAKTGNEMEDLSDETGGLTGKLKDITGIDLGGKLGKGLAVGAAVAGVKELAEGLIGLEESTREYRTIMGSLTVSSERAGYTADQTSAAYTRLFGVLGNTQTTATTLANFQALGLSQEQLILLTDMATGAWSKHGDSIPIDQMSEAILLGSQQSEVTGALADILEWAGVNQDEFKAKLEAGNSTAERANIIMTELATLGLAEAGNAWREENEEIVRTNEALARNEAAMGRLGEVIAPAATWLIDLKTKAIDFVADGLENLIQLFQALSNWSTKIPEIDSELMAETNAWIDGSHAQGLNRVPFDGYIAELHKGEMILPAAQAESLRALMTASPSTPETDFSGIAAGMVNGITTAMSGMGGNYRIEIPIVVNGREFSRAIVTDLRTVMKSDPEVTNA